MCGQAAHVTLVHSRTRKPVDMSVPFRFAAINSNSVLEVVAMSKRGKLVRVAIQLPGRRRFQTEVSSTTTLQHLIDACVAAGHVSSDDGARCTLSLMRKPLDPASYTTATLRSTSMATA